MRCAGPANVALFCERVADYRATVHRVPSGGLGEALVAACRDQRGATRLAVPVEAPADIEGVLTGCALGIAETGTIVLDRGGRSGRRALTLVPDAVAQLAEAARGPWTLDAVELDVGGGRRAGDVIT